MRFDINRNANPGLLLRSSADTSLDGVLLEAPRRFKTAILTNANPDSSEVAARITEAGAAMDQSRALGSVYPSDLFSLSHFAVNLGAMAARGERGTRSSVLIS